MHSRPQAQALACMLSLAALGELCRSAPVAARVATLRGLPAALVQALQVQTMDMCLYAAGACVCAAHVGMYVCACVLHICVGMYIHACLNG